MLKVQVAGQKDDIFVPLREPASRPPIPFKSLTGANQFRVSSAEKNAAPEVRFLPAQPKIVLSDVDVVGLFRSGATLRVEIRQNPPSGFSIRVGEDLPIHFTVSLEDPKDCRVKLVYTKVENWHTIRPSRSAEDCKPTLDDVAAEITQKQSRKKELDDAKRVPEKEKQDEIGKIDGEIERLKKLKGIAERLFKTAELAYRVSIAIGDQKVILVDASQPVHGNDSN
jgi:hypothetical protein